MSYLLDTNICILHFNGRNPEITDKLLSLSANDVFLCSIVKAELVFGARNSIHIEKNLKTLDRFFKGIESFPFDDKAADYFGAIQALLKKQGAQIGLADVMIASIAQTHDLTVVTRNCDHFSRIPTLRVESW